MTHKKHLLVIAGPTAVGKTDLAIALAKHFNTEILSADSRQFYREMELGTAKPSKAELEEIKHHFINSLSIHDEYTVGDFEREALVVLDQIFQTNDVAILVGGSGLFIKVLCDGMDQLPEVGEGIREQLINELESQGLNHLLEELKRTDPKYFDEVDQQNPQRVIRALEVIRTTGEPFSYFRTGTKVPRPFVIVKICLTRERDELYQRIDLRMDQMIAQGLFEEAEALFDDRHLNALQTVGYSEIFTFLEGKYDKEEAIRLLKRNSRRYAKRQMTWFKKDQEFTWYTPQNQSQIIKDILSRMS